MVFMEDSERAAAIAREHAIDAGLHLNFTTPFSGYGTSRKLIAQQKHLAKYLLSHRIAQVFFHPGLISTFRHVVAAQYEEYTRLYGRFPLRIDGHHHMHLCSNVLFAGLLPRGAVVRRNFSFEPGEKSFANRFYRQRVDHALSRRHRLTDYFFSLPPINPLNRLKRIFSLANQFTVEVETHPGLSDEYQFLLSDTLLKLVTNSPLSDFLAWTNSPANPSQ